MDNIEKRIRWYKKNWMDKIKKKELEETDEGFGLNIHQNSFTASLKKITNWKTPAHEDI